MLTTILMVLALVLQVVAIRQSDDRSTIRYLSLAIAWLWAALIVQGRGM